MDLFDASKAFLAPEPHLSRYSENELKDIDR